MSFFTEEPHLTISSLEGIEAAQANIMLAANHDRRPLDAILPGRIEVLLNAPAKKRHLPYLTAAGLMLRTIDEYKAAVAKLTGVNVPSHHPGV